MVTPSGVPFRSVHREKAYRDHTVLTSYSRMTVHLVVQASCACKYSYNTMHCLCLGPQKLCEYFFPNIAELMEIQANTTETEKFCRMFDRSFDIFSHWRSRSKREPDLKHFFSSTDERLEVICNYSYVQQQLCILKYFSVATNNLTALLGVLGEISCR